MLSFFVELLPAGALRGVLSGVIRGGFFDAIAISASLSRIAIVDFLRTLRLGATQKGRSGKA